MNVRVEQAREPLRGDMRVPGDKSIGHRAVIFSSLAHGKSVITGLSSGEDNGRTIRAFQDMGVVLEEHNEALLVEGDGYERLSQPERALDCGNSGTTMRLLAGVLSAQPFRAMLDGDDSLRSRPMKRVMEPLQRMGARIHSLRGNGCAPLMVQGGALHGIDYDMPIASAQVKSAVLLAGLQAEGSTVVREPSLSRDHTERMMPAFGASVEVSEGAVLLRGGQSLQGTEVLVPGDISSAAFLIVAALIVADSEMTIKNCGVNFTRTGVLDILRAMGGDIEMINPKTCGGEEVADLVVRSSRLRGVRIPPEVVPRAIDEYPILCVAAALAEGETSFHGAEELRHKESDRIAAIAEELAKLGVAIREVRPDGMTIAGRDTLKGAVVKSHADHRVAMALAVAGLRAGGGVEIQDSECVNTSFPGFFELLEGLKG
jgi:3-phosphoshikimate 1-carboxyvinyltransferase